MEEKQENKEVEEFKFDISEPTEKFTKHLEVPFNDRIILSAPFGAGKTYFLKEYFKRNNDKYETIHLFPVNYSVASNKDIFELIKYDILFELFGKDIEFDKTDFSKLDFLPFYLNGNKVSALETLTPLLNFIPKVGKTVADISKQLLSFYRKFEKQFDNIQIDDEDAALHYLESLNNKKGSIYEDDFYSQLIRQLVNQLKKINDQEEKEKKTVLIIDDLDRIDPEHIFRILNVLSAHMDKAAGENKFGFDKIILVFDQYNVRNIFANRYGVNVDYTGYIDKFYSYKVFEFSNKEGLQKDIITILKSIKSYSKFVDFDKDDVFVQGIVYVFQRLIQANVLTVRRLLKVQNQTIGFKQSFSSYNYPEVRFGGQFHILILAELLLFIYEDWEEVLYSIKRITELDFIEDLDNRSYVFSLINESLLLLDVHNHNFKESEDQYSYINKEYKLDLKYSFGYYKFDRLYYCTLKVNGRDELDDPQLLMILYLTLKEIKGRKILK